MSAGLIVDSFAGGGGASTGIERALGRPVDIAINHDAEALAMHAANHPATRHLCESVWDVDPVETCAGRRVRLAWFSPDCTFHSKARGSKPFRERNPARRKRGLAWVAVRWAKAVRPDLIMLENVEEFADWGPLLDDGTPCPLRKGLTFRRFVKQLQNCGYAVDWQELVAADFGAPTTRKRLFLIARCDGLPIVWPEPSHDRWGRGGLPKWRAAAECIDWSIPCPSIFERKRPLAEATLRRIARGIMRYVVNAAEPFIVSLANADFAERPGARSSNIDEPLRTIHAGGGNHALVAPTLINTRNGERDGQAPRVRDILEPFATVTAQGSQGAMVAAFLARHYGGHENDGASPAAPMHTVTAKDHHALVASHLIKLRGTSTAQGVDTPLHTISAGGGRGGIHFAEVRAFLIKFYGEGGQWSSPREPMHTIPTRDRMGLVTVHGEEYAIVDIGMRMLSPRELFLAQGFPPGYRIDIEFNGKPLTKTAQVRMCGNSVPPPDAEALVRANVVDVEQERAA